MEEMRLIRSLKKQLEAEFGAEDAQALAAALAGGGADAVTDAVRAKINYLQQICTDLPLGNYFVASLAADHSIEDIKERYELWVKYTGRDKCRADNLAFSHEKEEAYIALLSGLELSSEQIGNVMREAVELGSIAKSGEDARSIVDELKIFEIPDTVRNQFISDNAAFLFNDYSRKAGQVFEKLCLEHGKEGGFALLCKHPEYIRLGKDAVD